VSSAEPGVQLARIAYFGKLPARADFIKAAEHPAVLQLLDSWLAEVMNALSSDPRWKLHYDAMLPLDFAFSARGAGMLLLASCAPAVTGRSGAFRFSAPA
jgi:type VI secretion system ImpM family protein